MARSRLGIVTPQVRFTLNGTTWQGFVIEPLEDGKTLLWVAPPMIAEWGSAAEALLLQTAHNTDLALAMNPDATESQDVIASRIADRLELGQGAHQVKIRWDPQGDPPTIASPMHIKTETITLYQPPGRVIT